MFSVDALGLRPLWFGETEKEYFWSSERGVIPLGSMVRDPAPFSPGEKMVACLGGGTVRLHANENVQRFTEGVTIRKVIVVPGKLVNIVAN